MAYPYNVGYHPPPPYSQAAYPSYPAQYPPRQYYFIRSRMNGLTLDIEGENTSPGARVILWHQKPTCNNNQLWYDDPSTGTIRSKLNDYVLDIADGIVVNPFWTGNVNQQWERANGIIRNRAFPNRVLDVSGCNPSPGARIIPYDYHGGVNQLFDFQSIPQSAPTPPVRPQFFIVSEMNCKVLDIQGDNVTSGAKVIMWPRKPGRPSNQLWYFDNKGVIRSALNDFTLEAKTDGSEVRMMPYTGSPHQKWTLSGNRIMKNQFECLDIAGENKSNGAKVISYKYKGSANQHWRIEYV